MLLFTDKLIVNQLSMVESDKENFDNLLPFETFNMTYDWKSISHYSNKAFRKPFTLGYTLETKVSYKLGNLFYLFINLFFLICINYLLLSHLIYRNHIFSKLRPLEGAIGCQWKMSQSWRICMIVQVIKMLPFICFTLWFIYLD